MKRSVKQAIWMQQWQGVMAVMLLVFSLSVAGKTAKLAIVIDDFGYRPHNEKQILALPAPVSVSVLPNAPHAHEMAVLAHQRGHQVLIHLPMAPLSRQPLEKDTLFPAMSASEVQRIVHDALGKVPYAMGMNNHMGSAMTSSLSGMLKVMQALVGTQLFFLDSKTIATSQVSRAGQEYAIPVLRRDIFLDDQQNEAAIRQQLLRAIQLARRNGTAIAIGHPHPTTVRVLQQMLPGLPADIQLVAVGSLLQQIQHTSTVGMIKPGQCMAETTPSPVPVSRWLQVIWQSVSDWIMGNSASNSSSTQKN